MFDCILLMAGSGTRTSLPYNKIKFLINGKPLYKYSLNTFLNVKQCNKVILVVNKEEYDEYKEMESEKITVVIGGDTRFKSVLNGAKESNSDIVLIHDAARPNIKEEEILKVYNSAKDNDAVCLGVKVKDCIRMIQNDSQTIDRSNLWNAQTPQGVNRNLLIKGLESNKFDFYYDDCEVLEKNFGINCYMVEGRYDNIKVTTDEDLDYIQYLMGMNLNNYKVGHSKDTHKLVKERKLILGGIDIPFELGLLGHSDADVVYHCVVESIIGALGLGDIGKLFPDNDPLYKGISSSYFMEEVYKLMNKQNYEINNIDITIYIEKPILKDYKPLMEQNISKLLHCDQNKVNVKATRGEGIGYIGNMEGISAEAICLLKKI